MMNAWLVLDVDSCSTLLAAQRYSPMQVWIRLGLVVVLALGLVVVAVWIRRRLLGGGDEPPPVGFTLADLRSLHAAGQLSDEELAKAEAKAAARSRAHYLGDAATGPTKAQAEPTESDPADELDSAHRETDVDADRSGSEGLSDRGSSGDGSEPSGDADKNR